MTITAQLEAIVENGVLRPLDRLPFAEQQHVWVRVEPLEAHDVRRWLAQVVRHQKAVLDRQPPLPDSSQDIAEDRLRGI